MAQNVAGNTYEFEIVVPEFAEDAPEEAKAVAFFAVAFLGETIKGSTIAFGTDGAVVMCKQEGAKQTKMTGSYAQEGERLTVRGIPDFPAEGTASEDAVDFVQSDPGGGTGKLHLRFKKI